MKYKGYIGCVKYDDEAKIFHGEVVGLRDVITFQGRSVDGLEQAFKDSIEEYLAWCKERGERPKKGFFRDVQSQNSSGPSRKTRLSSQNNGHELRTFHISRF